MRIICHRLALLALLLTASPLLLRGQQWSTITPQGLLVNLYGLYFLDAEDGWIVGWGNGYSVLGTTTDGGATWQGWNMPNTLLFDVRFTDAATGYIAGYRSECSCGLLMTTTDGGESWMKEQSPTASVLTAVAPCTDGSAYVVGFEGAVLKRSGSAATVAIAHRSPESVAVSPNPLRSATRLVIGNDKLDGAW